VLRNNGSVLNESIDIQLSFPKSISFLEPGDFPTPDRINILKELNTDEGILSLVLKHNKDSKVKEYSSRFAAPPAYIPNLLFNESYKELKDKETNKYQDYLSSLYDYETFFDNQDKITIACNIDSIKPNDTVSLPCYFLTKSKEGFMIEYEINSKNLTSKVLGTLIVKSI